MNAKKIFSRPVICLSLASLLTDTASEAMYPLFPIFLTQVLKASAGFVGVFEGVADATASLSKYFFGALSDRARRREPLVIGGYTLANGVRPLIAFAAAPWQALGLRFVDRIGKGMRTAPRDAWLAAESTPETRGRVFGFNSAMDHAGAVLGPLLASAYLFYNHGHLRRLFLWTLVPGLLAAVAVAAAGRSINEAAGAAKTESHGGWSTFPPTFKRYLAILLIFTLGNSSDAFILLRLRDAGVAAVYIPLLWSALHVAKSSFSIVGGKVADAIGRKTAIVSGWLVYALSYFLFAAVGSAGAVIAVFIGYGIYYGLTEGAEKALTADFISSEARGA
ncbi:MAG: MFS transporter, partial [Elusimicrobia bacterium]|nr:MFS transporter [Elusimicrobiota bacterium]